MKTVKNNYKEPIKYNVSGSKSSKNRINTQVWETPKSNDNSKK